MATRKKPVRDPDTVVLALDHGSVPESPDCFVLPWIQAIGPARHQLLGFENIIALPADFKDHDGPTKGLRVTLDVPVEGKAYWYGTEDAHVLGTVPVKKGTVELDVPDFTIDLALLITPDGPPDIDQDGKPNHLDDDDDNDGVRDASDAFPLDPSEWADKDGDLIGDTLDADIDADGKGDDKNRNGIADHEEMDYDGDGFLRSGAVPWDAFPLDSKEWRDTDGDGIGDNADEDDDGDGFSDEQERKAGTDPLDRVAFPVP